MSMTTAAWPSPQRRETGNVSRRGLDAACPKSWTGDLRTAGRLAAVLSPFLTVEEAYLLGKYVRSIDPRGALVLGPVPVVGEDERFKNGFTISAEKCPNRRGVEAGRSPFYGTDRHTGRSAGRKSNAARSGACGSPADTDAPGSTTPRPQRLGKAAISGRPGPVPVAACRNEPTYVLPAAAFAERDGSYVNRHDHLQSVRWAIRPPGGVRPEGSLFWELLGKPGPIQRPGGARRVGRGNPLFRRRRRADPRVGVN